MAQRHVSETVQMQKLVGGLRLGEDTGVLVDADLSSLSAAKTAVDADCAKRHVSERAQIAARVKASLDISDQFLTNYTTGGDVSDYDALPDYVEHRGQFLVL